MSVSRICEKARRLAHSPGRIAIGGWILAPVFAIALIGLILACSCVSSEATDQWDGGADYSWYNADKSLETYSIGTAKELKGLSDIVNGADNFAFDFKGKTITLSSDLDLNGSAYKWKPIGGNANKFRGIFDGRDHTISNMRVAEDSYAGLFGNVNGGTVKNIRIGEGCAVVAANFVGGVIGYADHATILNCNNAGTISSTESYAGGIIGYSTRSIVENCNNTGKVSSVRDFAGGIAARAMGTTFNNCSNLGNVSVRDYAGGLTGYIDAATSIQSCSNSGNMTARDYAGGAVGRAVDSTIKDYNNTGAIAALRDYSGGIAGRAAKCVVQDCKNVRAIAAGGHFAGGAMGWAEGTTVRSCENTGTVAAIGNVGATYGFQKEGSAHGCKNICKIIETGKYTTASPLAEVIMESTDSSPVPPTAMAGQIVILSVPEGDLTQFKGWMVNNNFYHGGSALIVEDKMVISSVWALEIQGPTDFMKYSQELLWIAIISLVAFFAFAWRKRRIEEEDAEYMVLRRQ